MVFLNHYFLYVPSSSPRYDNSVPLPGVSASWGLFFLARSRGSMVRASMAWAQRSMARALGFVRLWRYSSRASLIFEYLLTPGYTVTLRLIPRRYACLQCKQSNIPFPDPPLSGVKSTTLGHGICVLISGSEAALFTAFAGLPEAVIAWYKWPLWHPSWFPWYIWLLTRSVWKPWKKVKLIIFNDTSNNKTWEVEKFEVRTSVR